jgi:hypothetical protein
VTRSPVGRTTAAAPELAGVTVTAAGAALSASAGVAARAAAGTPSATAVNSAAAAEVVRILREITCGSFQEIDSTGSME